MRAPLEGSFETAKTGQVSAGQEPISDLGCDEEKRPAARSVRRLATVADFGLEAAKSWPRADFLPPEQIRRPCVSAYQPLCQLEPCSVAVVLFRGLSAAPTACLTSAVSGISLARCFPATRLPRAARPMAIRPESIAECRCPLLRSGRCCPVLAGWPTRPQSSILAKRFVSDVHGGSGSWDAGRGDGNGSTWTKIKAGLSRAAGDWHANDDVCRLANLLLHQESALPADHISRHDWRCTSIS